LAGTTSLSASWKAFGVVMAGPYGDEEIHHYTRRLIRVLGNPQLVLPTHWDNFRKTFDVPQNTSSGVSTPEA
jgi:hypothetical protein